MPSISSYKNDPGRRFQHMVQLHTQIVGFVYEKVVFVKRHRGCRALILIKSGKINAA